MSFYQVGISMRRCRGVDLKDIYGRRSNILERHGILSETLITSDGRTLYFLEEDEEEEEWDIPPF